MYRKALIPWAGYVRIYRVIGNWDRVWFSQIGARRKKMVKIVA
jgi:hypothetical protein